MLALALVSVVHATPVEKHGQLSVQGTKIIDKNGDVMVLRGMSLFWSQAKEAFGYYNAEVVNWLADDWHANVIRIPLGVEGDWGEGGESYLTSPAKHIERVRTVVDAAIAKGIYVLIDWHDHNAHQHQAQAIAFFEEMAQLYGDKPNIIYEIYNEPTDIAWTTIKSYSEAVIAAIRKYDSKNIIAVGTPKWSSEVVPASKDPITSYQNIVYAFHFYASESWHYLHYRAKADSAINNGLPLFVTEWGNSDASGNGALIQSNMDAFMNWMQEKQLSWCNWSIVGKNETSAALKAGNFDTNGNFNPGASYSGGWTDNDLTQSGKYVREKMRLYNPSWESTVVPVLKRNSKTSATVRQGVFDNNKGILLYDQNLDIQGRVR